MACPWVRQSRRRVVRTRKEHILARNKDAATFLGFVTDLQFEAVQNFRPEQKIRRGTIDGVKIHWAEPSVDQLTAGVVENVPVGKGKIQVFVRQAWPKDILKVTRNDVFAWADFWALLKKQGMGPESPNGPLVTEPGKHNIFRVRHTDGSIWFVLANWAQWEWPPRSGWYFYAIPSTFRGCCLMQVGDQFLSRDPVSVAP